MTPYKQGIKKLRKLSNPIRVEVGKRRGRCSSRTSP